MKNLIPAAAASAALLALAACDNAPQTVNTLDAQAEALKNAPPVELPPSITASKQYRCRDNSLYIVDFYNNNSARVRTSQDGAPTVLTSEDADGPYAGEGYSLSGNGNTVTVNGKSCHT